MSPAMKDSYKLPARVEVVGIDDTIASLKDLDERRKALHSMIDSARREIVAIEKTMAERIELYQQQLRVQKAELLSS